MLIYGSTKIDFSGADPYFIELFKKFLNDSKIDLKLKVMSGKEYTGPRMP